MTLLGAVLLACAALLAAMFGPGAPLGAAIFALHPPFLNTLQAGVQRNLAPWIWDSLFLPVLTAPAWLPPAVLGVLALVLAAWRGRRPHG